MIRTCTRTRRHWLTMGAAGEFARRTCGHGKSRKAKDVLLMHVGVHCSCFSTQADKDIFTELPPEDTQVVAGGPKQRGKFIKAMYRTRQAPVTRQAAEVQKAMSDLGIEVGGAFPMRTRGWCHGARPQRRLPRGRPPELRRRDEDIIGSALVDCGAQDPLREEAPHSHSESGPGRMRP